MDHYAVIGNPIAHSKSPQIHAAFARQTGQQLVYEAVLAPVDGFIQTVADFRARGGLGLNVTVPFKLEAFALAEKLGLEPERFFEIASKSSGQCWRVSNYYPWAGPVPTAPSNRNYDGGFATAMMLKDLKLAQDAAAKVGASTPLGAQTEALFQMFNGLGYGGRDFSAILQMLRGKLEELPKG